MSTLEGFDEFDGIELFQRLPIFRGLNFDETRRLAAISRSEDRKAGEVLVEQNELGQALFIVRKGTVRVTKELSVFSPGGAAVIRPDAPGAGSSEVELGTMGEGELFGEMSLVDDVLTSARVTAASDVSLFVIPRRDFDELLGTDFALALKVYRAFCRTLSLKLRQLHERVAPPAGLELSSH